MKGLAILTLLVIVVVDSFCQTSHVVSKTITMEKYVDVDGHKMHCQVAGVGSPTVVFEGGVTDNSNSWNPLFADVAKFTRAVSYDRMGLGASDTTSTPRSFKQIASELHSLLHNANVLPPYILVGHSMGGGIIRAFAHLYKTEIAGMVFIDCMTEYDIKGMPKDSLEKNLPPESVSRRATPQESELYLLRTEVFAGFPEMRSFDVLPDVPVDVFVGQKNTYPLVVNNRIEWYQKSISNQMQSTLTILPAASHYVHRDYPGLIVWAILKMVFPNPDIELERVLQNKGVDSCIARYKKMKAVYPAELIGEGTLNKLGYIAMGRGDFQGAVKLFELNVAMYPYSFNTYDSLGEAYASTHNKKEAIKNYNKSLELNDANKNAAEMLAKLKTMK